MSRQVNLYNPALLEQGDRLPGALFARLVLGLSAGLVVLCLALAMHLHISRQHMQENEARLAQSQQKLAALTTALQSRRKNESLQQQRRQAEQLAEQHQRVLARLTAGLAVHAPGYAAYMQALARQSFDGLWLTGFEFAAAGGMDISGRALKAEFLPQYIARLKQEPAMQGKAFDTLDMGAAVPKAETGALAGPGGDSGAIAFSLHSRQEKGR